MRNFTNVKFWLLLMVMGLMVSTTVAQTEPKLGVAPDPLNLGEWPIGGWQEAAYLQLTNDGSGTVNVTASELDDVDGVFTLTNPTLPVSISAFDPAVMVGVSFTSTDAVDGVYDATYVASWGTSKSVTTADITVSAYTAAEGDIVENPFMVALPHVDAGVSTGLPMRSNYNLPGAAANGKDVVYKFTLAEDQEVSVAITAATETPKIALYAAGFEGEGGPMVTNAAFVGTTDIVAAPLFAGDYYLVVSCEAADAAMTFDIDINSTTMPDPECVINAFPVDGAIEVPSNGLVLAWEYGMYAQEYQVLFGTTYPPSDVVVDWTTVNPMGDSYALANLNPSFQYFWQVNVRNNNATVVCDAMGFTTTLTPPADLTATVVMVGTDENDYNVVLNWTSSAKAHLGYNVYRDGAMINTSLVTVDTYTDLSVPYNMDPCYEYQVEAIFDEGVSAMSNVATACVTGTGMVDGFVTALLTGNPIEGAVVEFDGTSYSATTDLVGYYSMEVLEGTYDYTVSADGYITETMEDVDVAYNTTVSLDFELDEFPYPVNDVVAFEINENTVQVDWGNNGGGGGNVAEWIFYDDGTNVDGIGGPATFSWAVKFDADQLVDFPGSAVTKIQIFARTADAIEVNILQGDNGETTVYSETISGLTVLEWNEVELSAPAAFDNSQALWISCYTAAGTVYPAGCGPAVGEANSDLITLDGILWEHLSDFGLPYSWNLRAFVTDGGGKSAVIGETTANDYKAENTALVAANVAPPAATATITGVADKNDKDLMGYNVYRQVCNEETPMEFLGMTLDNQFTDNTWGAVTWGTYKWAVEVIYTNNVSEVAYSNCLDKDMIATVDVTVTTNSGDAPEGCEIVFTNTSEAGMGYDYELELDATGMATIEEFRKGTYDISVMLDGFAPIADVDVLVDMDMSFVWQLMELLAPPSDLYVTPTGFATWTGGGAIPFEPYFENFDTQEAFDMWEVVVGGSTADSWFWSNGSNNQYGETLDGTGFAMVDSDDAGSGTNMNELFISPVIDADGVDELFIEFDQYYNNLNAAELADVEVFDGSDWVTVLHQNTDQGSWAAPAHTVIDVTEYANADFRVRFHYLAPGWDWHWAVDNVMVHDNSGKFADDKAFQFYKVWLDQVFVADADTNFYQYGENGEELVAGQTYEACVATLYSTGLSAQTCYVWTYLPCDSFAAPAAMYADVTTPGGDDVLVNWSEMLPLELVELNQGYGAPANGYYQSYGLGYGVAYDLSTYPDALVSMVDFHHASWGTTGTWDFNIHIIDWDTKTTIAVVGPFQTTGNDVWEEGVLLGDVSTGGAATVAILMEPLSNDAADAYPDLSSDSDTDPAGSVYGDLADLPGMGASTIGKFLMDLHIYTANGGKAMPTVMNVNEGPAATPRVATDYTFNPNVIVNQVANKANKAAAIALGTNVYRDGMMLAFVPEPDTFYLDMNLEPGYYDFCIATVYSEDDGDHTWTSCPDALCVTDVLVNEDCLAPENLTATDEAGDGPVVVLNWNAPNGFEPVWLQYDDGTNVDAIGGPTEFSYAVKWDPSQIADLDGAALTKVKFFPREAGTAFTLKVWKGANAGTLVHEQPLSGLTFDAWNEVDLSTAIEVDVTEELWVGFYVVTGGYPAGCGNATGSTNSDLITLDGSLWEHLADFGLPYSWNLGAYFEAAKGNVVELPSLVDHATYSGNATVTNGNLPASPNAVYEGVRALTGYNVYRDGEQVNEELVMGTTYTDELDHETASYCWEVTAVYSVCGESDPSNEVCLDVFVGLNDLENNVSVYPNPATDFVMVEASSDIRSIEITNYMGQVVNSTKSVEMTQTRINTSDLSAGIYFVEVETAAGIEKVRIVISK